jgi:hypothetical protein
MMREKDGKEGGSDKKAGPLRREDGRRIRVQACARN